MVSRIDETRSLQWMECSRCGSDQLVSGQGGASGHGDRTAGTGWHCVTCDQEQEAPEHRVELVARLGVTWARLRSDTAKTILPPGNMFSAFHPADVIGQVVPPTLAVMGEDMIAQEVMSSFP